MTTETTYADRVASLEAEGLPTSDAQAIAEAEGFDPTEERPHDPMCGVEGELCSVCKAAEWKGPGVLSISVDYDPDLVAESAWQALVVDEDGYTVAQLVGPSAHDVLLAAAKEVDRYVASRSRVANAEASRYDSIEGVTPPGGGRATCKRCGLGVDLADPTFHAERYGHDAEWDEERAPRVGDPCERCGEPTTESDVAEVGAGTREHETMLVHASCMLAGEPIA